MKFLGPRSFLILFQTVGLVIMFGCIIRWQTLLFCGVSSNSTIPQTNNNIRTARLKVVPLYRITTLESQRKVVIRHG